MRTRNDLWKIFWWKWYRPLPELPIIQEITEVVGNMRILEDQLRKDLNSGSYNL